jgi:hypothetical protein
MHHQFNIQQLYALPTLYYVFCIYLRTNSDLCHLQHKLIGFYNQDKKCLQRGTDWVFKYSILRFVFKWLILSNAVSLPHPNITVRLGCTSLHILLPGTQRNSPQCTALATLIKYIVSATRKFTRAARTP